MPTPTVKVYETFQSIESEGLYQGMPLTHISFPTCHNQCPGCQLPFFEDPTYEYPAEELTPQDVAGLARNSQHVLLGCGDVMLQPEAEDFILELTRLVPHVVVESAAVDPLTTTRLKALLRDEYGSAGVLFHLLKTSDRSVLPMLRAGRDSLKIVPTSLSEMHSLLDIVRSHPIEVWTHVYPCPNEPQRNSLSAYFNAVRDLGREAWGLKVKVGLIMHAYAGVR